MYIPTYLPIYLSIHLSLYLSISLSLYLSIYLSMYLSIFLSIFLSIHTHIYICVCVCSNMCELLNMKHVYSYLFSTCRVRVSRFYQSYLLLLVLLLLLLLFPSTASSRSQCALPDLNRELQISVGTAGPQPRAPDFSGHCRTSTHARENVRIDARWNAWMKAR